MDNLDLENLGNEELVELLEIFQGMQDELVKIEEEKAGESDGKE